VFFFFNDTATTEIYTLSLHDALPICWVPVDPADVRKVVLEEPPGNRSLNDELVKKARVRLFGSWEMNWMAYNFAHDVALPGSRRPPVGFFMYPQAETSDGRVDSLDPDSFKYEITSREISFAN